MKRLSLTCGCELRFLLPVSQNRQHVVRLMRQLLL